MNTVSTESLVRVLVALKEQYPHWRMGQLIANVADWADRNIWDAEDDELLEAAERHLSKLERPPETVA